ncbi:MAG: questin oxidase family protein [Stellaceae bacterium]
MRTTSYASFDDALETLAGYGIELSNGNSNHAPMVAEALCAMGRPDAVMPWLSRYRERMLPRLAAGDRIFRDRWRSALGRRDRFTDWAVFFDDELQQAPWAEVLDQWVARLAPGFCAAATHGAIRLGHAVRSLMAAETQWRLRELADALASWAATYQELPTSDLTSGTMTPRQAVANLPIIAPHSRRSLGNITKSLAMLDDLPEFAPVIGLLDVSNDIERLLAELNETFARLYLANAHDVLTTIVFIHGVTSLAAVGNMIPAVSQATARSLVRFAWQSGCALYACFGTQPMAEVFPHRELDENILVDHAVANGDEHVIKFTEACLRRHALDPLPVYPAAVESALRLMQRR